MPRVHSGRLMHALRSIVVCAVVSCCCPLSACAPAAEHHPPVSVSLITGPPGAGFHPLGLALLRELGVALPDLRFTMLESEGAVSNLEALQRGDADLGLAFADVTYGHYVGRLDRQVDPFQRLRGIVVLHLTEVHLMVRSGAGIRTIADLRNRAMAVGPRGSGTTRTAALLLRSFGLSEDDVVQKWLPFMDAARHLVAGRVDAMFVNAGYPAESIQFGARAGARLLDVTGPVIDQLRAEYPFLHVAVIPGGIYPGHQRTVRTVGLRTLLLCRADLDEELVYRLTKGFFDVLPDVASTVPALRRMDLERAAALPIPLHSGAARYYRERELFR
jgi:TRAP transporter TAXI family solute receptor